MSKLQEKQIKLLYKAFECGVDYGQLLMEEERQNEESFDAFLGVSTDKKFCMPTCPAERRQCHSEKWFTAKRKGYREFIRLIKE